jgi:molybdopterin-containing oxidoreductase family iron-sulfur binding subunit
MVIDLDRCTGCEACAVACKAENNVPVSPPSEAAKGRELSWLTVTKEVTGSFPNPKLRFLPQMCMQCDDPPCIKVCPVRATYKNHEGLVAQVYSRCIGCRYCTMACPYTAKYFNWYTPEWDEESRKSWNPDVSIRPKGVVEKCSFCHHRLQNARDKARAEDRDLNPGEYLPACVQSCPADAMVFGDLDDPDSEVHRLSRSSRAFRLHEDLGTNPKVYYLSEGEWHG